MKYTVIGAARSGLAAAKLCKRLKYEVFLTESQPLDKCEDTAKKLSELEIPCEFGHHSKRAYDCDIMISSPGVPPKAEIIKKAEELNIPIISELEFAARHLENPIIAITGTNGKTTTTALTAFIFQHSGRKAVAAGNIGDPLSNLVGEIDKDTVIVAETSSYQLDRIQTFCPEVAMVLNISPDHLSYHGSYQQYCEAKWKISSMQSQENLLILNFDNSDALAGEKYSKAQISKFSIQGEVDWGICLKNGNIIFKEKHNEEVLMSVSELALPGIHNIYNSMAAALAARRFEIPNEDIRDSLMLFRGVEHRLELVKTINNIKFVNDSKATNINATWYALSSYERPIIWIAGGIGDNNNYSELDELVKNNVKSIICMGEEKDNIFNHFAASKRCRKADTMQQAVAYSFEEADEGDVVLFAPACKSFDMFMNYEHRGNVFKEIVNKL